MRRTLPVVFLCIGCFCLGLFADRLLRTESQAAGAAPSTQIHSSVDAVPQLNRVACAVSIDPEMLRHELTIALKSVSAINTAAAPQPEALANQEPPPLPSPAQVTAFDNAHKVLQAAMTQGQMSKAQSQQMRDLLPNIDAESRQDLRLEIARAVNQGKLRFEDRRPPF